MLPYINRPVFFEDQVLGDEDLDAIVAYARDRDRRHALGPHTWGVVFGLSLLEQEEPDGTLAYILTPGVAVDGYGRLIVVERPLRVAEALLRDEIDPAVPLWIGYSEDGIDDTRPGFNTCGDVDRFRRIQEGFQLRAGRLNAVRDRHDGIVVGDVELEDPREFGALVDPEAKLQCDASIPVQSMEDRTPVARWWVPLGYVGWVVGAPGSFRAMSDAERQASRTLRRYAGLVTEDILAADGMLRLRPRFTERPPGKSVDDACAADVLKTSDFTVVDGEAVPNDLVSIEGDARALGQVKLWGTRLEFRKPDGTDADVPLYLRRAAAAGGESLDVVLGEDATPDNRLAIGVATAFGDIVANVVVKADGHVGIGALAPEDYHADANRMVIESDAATGMTIATPSAETGAIHFADGTAAAENAQGRVSYDHSRDVMQFATDGTVGVTIDHKGRVGIGTESPRTGLHVMNGQDVNLSNSSGYVLIGDVGGLNVVMDNNEIQARNAGATSSLHVQAEGGDFIVHQNRPVATKVAITDAGRVGIGTTAPETTLHLKGDDPDIKLDMNSASPNQLCEVRFAEDGVVGSKLWWNRTDKRTYLDNAGGTPITLDGSSLGVGIGAATPTTRLHVRDTKSASASNLDAHVALIENTSATTDADVLALRVLTPFSGSGNNFITFFDGLGPVGAIEGNGGSVSFNTAGADFAETLPKVDPSETIVAGEVVGVHAGKVSRRTKGADTVLVATTKPAVLGNAGGKLRDGSIGVTFVGQAPVKVDGPVRPGDLLVASGKGDGVAVAVAVKAVSPDDLGRLIGQAWSGHAGTGPGEVIVAVGVGLAAAAQTARAASAADRERLDRLEAELAELKQALAGGVKKPARRIRKPAK